MTRKALLGSIVPAVVAILAVNFGTQWYANNKALSPSEVNEVLVKAMSEFSKTLPVVIDEYTRVDSVAAGDLEITYFHTITGFDENLLTTELWSSIEARTRESATRESEIEIFRRNGVDMHYIYLAEDGHELFRFVLEH
ncbi:MAG: hypothetical protein KKA42_08125 [candidate division Zixibacteria bacterium]|nr:hypothetical protein [candidate division Zixibacteria bacterium]